MADGNIASFPQSSPSDSDNQDVGQDVGGVSGARLKAFVERIERLEEEKKAIAEDIKEVYGEAKATGFDVKAIRKLVSLRKMDANKRAEEEAILETYKAAVGLA